MNDFPLKVVFLGDAGVGKTSLINALMGISVEINEKPTIQTNQAFSFDTEINDMLFHISIWDTAGQEQYRSITKNYYRDCALAVLVYSITSKDSYDSLQYFINELQNNSFPPPIIFVGNKSDIDEMREVDKQDAFKLQSLPNSCFIETSAILGYGIPELFVLIKTQCAHVVETHPQTLFPSFNRDIKETKEKKKCC